MFLKQVSKIKRKDNYKHNLFRGPAQNATITKYYNI